MVYGTCPFDLNRVLFLSVDIRCNVSVLTVACLTPHQQLTTSSVI
jgi:hypothetical protein